MAIVWTDLIALTTPAPGDILCIVDVSDTTQSPEGSSKQITLANLFTRGTVTASAPIIDASQTWNAGGVTFAGVKIAITNTASAAASLPFQILGGVGGVTNLLSVRIDGLVTAAGAVTVTGVLTGSGGIVGDLTGNVTGNVTGSAGSVAASGITGTVAIANGGTNLTTYTQGDILYASAANTLSKLAKGTSGQFLQIGASIPAWADASLPDPAQVGGLYTAKGSALGVANGGTFDVTIPNNNDGLLLVTGVPSTGGASSSLYLTRNDPVAASTSVDIVTAANPLSVTKASLSEFVWRFTNTNGVASTNFYWTFIKFGVSIA